MMSWLNVRRYTGIITIWVIVFMISSCTNQKPKPISIGVENCDFCLMGIANNRLAGEIVSPKGKVYKFDSIECLASFYQDHKLPEPGKDKIWVHDFFHPKEWLPGKSTYFLHSKKINTPMGMGLIALKNESQRATARSRFEGTEMDWNQVLRYVKMHMKP